MSDRFDIFVTVGTQLPFDRMVKAVDAWAGEHAGVTAFAQTGPAEYCPRHLTAEESITPERFDELMRSCRVIVAHAGMGSILTALSLGKPIVIMPRKASLGEQRNEHQAATASRFEGRAGVLVARDEEAVAETLDRALAGAEGGSIAPHAQDSLIAAVREVIDSCRPGTAEGVSR